MNKEFEIKDFGVSSKRVVSNTIWKLGYSNTEDVFVLRCDLSICLVREYSIDFGQHVQFLLNLQMHSQLTTLSKTDHIKGTVAILHETPHYSHEFASIGNLLQDR